MALQSGLHDGSAAASVRKRPALFRALGNSDPPKSISLGSGEYHVETVLKHDSWAATAVYSNLRGERIICKFNRTASAFGIPMSWLGRALAAREAGFLRRLAQVELAPDDLGPVVADGRELRHAMARTYVEGEAFQSAAQIRVEFFAELRRLLDAIHTCDMAYVDLHKRENIIVDRDGRPHLIDFQVSFGAWPRWPGNGRFVHFITRKLQAMDDYHYRKHYARCFPETLTPEQLRQYLEPPGFIRAHRVIGVPLRGLRRRLLASLKIRDRSGDARSELEPEDAFRSSPADLSSHNSKPAP